MCLGIRLLLFLIFVWCLNIFLVKFFNIEIVIVVIDIVINGIIFKVCLKILFGVVCKNVNVIIFEVNKLFNVFF